jgi:hypothetical protein
MWGRKDKNKEKREKAEMVIFVGNKHELHRRMKTQHPVV